MRDLSIVSFSGRVFVIPDVDHQHRLGDRNRDRIDLNKIEKGIEI